MNQPLMFKKQFISIIVLTIIIVSELIFSIQIPLLVCTIFYFLLCISITCVPSIRGFKFSRIIRMVLYYIPMIVPLTAIHIELKYVNNAMGIVAGILISILLIVSNYKVNLYVISEKNPLIYLEMKKNELVRYVYLLIVPIICEELFFRYFIIGYLKNTISYYSIIISTLAFFHSHYMNRWANSMFNKKAYVYHCIFGLTSGLLFYYTGSLIGCIAMHFIFNNSIDMIVTYKRLNVKNISNSNDQLFNDYN